MSGWFCSQSVKKIPMLLHTESIFYWTNNLKYYSYDTNSCTTAFHINVPANTHLRTHQIFSLGSQLYKIITSMDKKDNDSHVAMTGL